MNFRSLLQPLLRDGEKKILCDPVQFCFPLGWLSIFHFSHILSQKDTKRTIAPLNKVGTLSDLFKSSVCNMLSDREV